MFHCDPEALGQIPQPIVSVVTTIVTNSSLGYLPAQGCSGDGTVLACLFNTDLATGSAAGTLKVLDATTLQPLWGSAGVPNSFNLSSGAADGQVPTLFTDGKLVAGAAGVEVLYNTTTGVAMRKMRLSSGALNFGLTPIAPTAGVISQNDGTLTLINTKYFIPVGTLKLTDPVNGEPLRLAAPSSGGVGVLYAIAYNPATNAAYLFSVYLTKTGLAVNSAFPFVGQSGASPVVVQPSTSGLSGNLIIINAPGLPSDNPPQNRWLALFDQRGSSLTLTWALPLSGTVAVSPVVDPNTRTLFYQLQNSGTLYQADLLSGAAVASYDMRTIGGFPTDGGFVLNGHVGASIAGGMLTLLLAGQYATSPDTGAEYVFTFQPSLNPNGLEWSSTIANAPAQYTAAWNFVTSSQSGTYCPIAITDTGMTSSIVRVCDF